jgi:hypothetical protein
MARRSGNGFLLALAALVAIIVQPASAQEQFVPPDGPWVHAPTGTAFPQQIGDFTRTRVVKYDATGADSSVGYNYEDASGQLTVTIYVYPLRPSHSCADHFASARQSIEERYEGWLLIRLDSAPSPDGARNAVADRARYHLPARGIGDKVPDMWSDVYLHCPKGERWLVKYRASWDGTQATFPDMGQFMAAIPWPTLLR